MRLLFLTIPKPLKQHPIFRDLEKSARGLGLLNKKGDIMKEDFEPIIIAFCCSY
jgi:hypothetical protein